MPTIEYKRHRVGKRQYTTPTWVEDGGYWYSNIDHTLIGHVPENPEWYVPKDVVRHDKQSFIERLLKIHELTPIMSDNIEEGELNEEQVIEMGSSWFEGFDR